MLAESLDIQGRLRAWSYLRQGLGKAASQPLAALRDVIAVYSSHPTTPLSLLARSPSLDAEGFHEMERSREAVRIPGMRGSIFFVPTDTASRVFAATRPPLERLIPRLRYAGLDLDAYARLKPRVLENTQEPIKANDLRRALNADEKLMIGVRVMTLEGLVLRLGTSLRTDNLRYVATEAWLDRSLDGADPEESLGWLAGEYLRGYGPARVEDFAWWVGVSKGRARAAVARAGTVDIGGGMLLPPNQQQAFENVEPVDADAIDILPKWDAYTMGHAPDGRQRLVNDEHLRSAYSTGGAGTLPGDGLPLVLRGGRAVGRWSHRFEGNRMDVKVVPFEPNVLSAPLYEHVIEEVGHLLGATSVEVIEEV